MFGICTVMVGTIPIVFTSLFRYRSKLKNSVFRLLFNLIKYEFTALIHIKVIIKNESTVFIHTLRFGIDYFTKKDCLGVHNIDITKTKMSVLFWLIEEH